MRQRVTCVAMLFIEENTDLERARDVVNNLLLRSTQATQFHEKLTHE